MRLLLTALSAFLASIALGILLVKDTGRVVLMFGDWNVQTSTSVFAAVVLLTLAAAWMLARIVAGIFRMPQSVRNWRAGRRQRHAETLLARGLLAMVEGEWSAAERAFERGAALSRVPFIHHLYAARAAQRQGEDARRDRHLERAEKSGPGSALAVGLTQAELELGEGRVERAAAILRDLEARQPNARQVRRLSWEVSRRLRNWGRALELLAELDDSKSLPADQINAGRVEAYAGLLREAGHAMDRSRLDSIWNSIPRRARREGRVLAAYVGERLRFPGTGDCEEALRDHLNRARDADLMRLYGLVEGTDALKQLKSAERWLQEQPRDPALLLALGRLCRRGGLWGKARNYLEESISLEPAPEAFRELAAMYEQQGDAAAAADWCRRGLALVAGGPAAAATAPGAVGRQRRGA